VDVIHAKLGIEHSILKQTSNKELLLDNQSSCDLAKPEILVDIHPTNTTLYLDTNGGQLQTNLKGCFPLLGKWMWCSEQAVANVISWGSIRNDEENYYCNYSYEDRAFFIINKANNKTLWFPQQKSGPHIATIDVQNKTFEAQNKTFEAPTSKAGLVADTVHANQQSNNPQGCHQASNLDALVDLIIKRIEDRSKENKFQGILAGVSGNNNDENNAGTQPDAETTSDKVKTPTKDNKLAGVELKRNKQPQLSSKHPKPPDPTAQKLKHHVNNKHQPIFDNADNNHLIKNYCPTQDIMGNHPNKTPNNIRNLDDQTTINI
jgi:hypothetical protein